MSDLEKGYKDEVLFRLETLLNDNEKVSNKNEYGLYFTSSWDYSQTTLKQLYNFIELYTTQRDENRNMFSYMLSKVNNKKAYLQKQIDLGNIKMIKEIEF